jgi:UDP-N-acetylglucosamine 3-dehydrogenase
MARRLRVGFIGTGRKKDRPDLTGFFMAYQHAAGYHACEEQCEMVACADIVRENAEAFAASEGIAEAGIYTDYHRMLALEHLDMVSICTWPHLHAPMVLDCAKAGVRAIHCEKPMADTWGAARLMAQECFRHCVQLTFNHQRRFGAPFTRARDALRAGRIGALTRCEIGSVDDMLDDGTHWIDSCGFFTGDEPVDWVLGQIDYRREQRAFGLHGENQTFALWRYRSGVFGTIATGPGSPFVGALIRLLGSDGVMEIAPANGPLLRIRATGQRDWETIDTGDEGLHDAVFAARAVGDAIDALLSGRESEVSARRALNATEIIFAIFESSRGRGRIDLPLRIHDNPLQSMVDAGQLAPAPAAQ